MGKRAIIFGSVLVIAVLLFISTLLIVPRHPTPAVTVHHVKSSQSENWFTETFEITNHTTSFYFLEPFVSVEVQNGAVWQECFQSGPPQANPNLIPHGFQSFMVQTTNLPVGSPLRLKLLAGKRLDGLGGLFLRLKFRFQQGQKQVSLNPFSKTNVVLDESIEILSDEFVEPEPK